MLRRDTLAEALADAQALRERAMQAADAASLSVLRLQAQLDLVNELLQEVPPSPPSEA